MSEDETENLVAAILSRLKKPVLIMVTSGSQPYQQAIVERLKTLNMRFRIAITPDISGMPADNWRLLGEILPARFSDELSPDLHYQALILPFMDYPLAAQITSGILQSAASKMLHQALLCGIPVFALRYVIDPKSEFNQIRFSPVNPGYLQRIQSTLSLLETCGVTLCTMNELMNHLDTSQHKVERQISAQGRYITLSELINNPVPEAIQAVKFTDAALDYLKSKKM